MENRNNVTLEKQTDDTFILNFKCTKKISGQMNSSSRMAAKKCHDCERMNLLSEDELVMADIEIFIERRNCRRRKLSKDFVICQRFVKG